MKRKLLVALERLTSALRRALELRYDLALALGLFAIFYGIGQISRPAAWIFAGMALSAAAVLGEVARLRRGRMRDREASSPNPFR
jgi:hypothetical protein